MYEQTDELREEVSRLTESQKVAENKQDEIKETRKLQFE